MSAITFGPGTTEWREKNPAGNFAEHAEVSETEFQPPPTESDPFKGENITSPGALGYDENGNARDLD